MAENHLAEIEDVYAKLKEEWHILVVGLLLHFVLFIPVCSLVLLRLICFLVIYITNYLCDVIYALL